MSEEVLQEVVIDEAKVAALQKALEAKVSELSNKVYAVSMNSGSLEVYSRVIESITWKGKEGLGVLEITKKLKEVIKNGISNDVIFLNALTIEASHYFLNRYESKGSDDAEKFIDLYKKLEQALSSVSQDNKDLEDLNKDLAAAQQGLEAV
jgi:hypothetical protein